MNKDKKTEHILQTLEWFALIAVFLLAGTIGHDPWKQDETYSFGIIYHFYTTHTWLVPTDAGVPFMEKPPLYYWSAVLSCKLFSILPLHDAARLTSVFYMLVTTVFTWKLSQSLFQNHPDRNAMGWMGVALFLGSVGLVRHAHDMFTDVALLTGTTITLLGMAMLTTRQECWKQAGVWLGIGIGIAFMSKGFLTPAILGISSIALWCVLPGLRTRKTSGAVLIALVVAAPFLCLWPILLYQHSPALFMGWFWENNIGRFLGFSVRQLGADNTAGYFLYTILWFAFPVLPLACVTVVCERSNWRKPEYLLPLSVCITGMALLLASASARALYLIPLLPALTMLAAQGLLRIPPRFLGVWNVVMRILFSFGGALVWVIWWSLLHPATAQPFPPLSNLFGQFLPIGFVPATSQTVEYILAIFMTLFWLLSLRFKGDSPVNTARIWFTGVAVLWGLSHSLLLPWINETKSYRTVIMDMNAYVRQSPHAHDCIGNYNLGESIAPMLQYFGDRHAVAPIQNFSGTACPLLLAAMTKETPEDIDPEWNMVWRGSRVLDTKDEELRLYARKK